MNSQKILRQFEANYALPLTFFEIKEIVISTPQTTKPTKPKTDIVTCYKTKKLLPMNPIVPLSKIKARSNDQS